MDRRTRLFAWITAFGALTMLSAGITGLVLYEPEEEFPSEWDPRVLDLAHFVERERGALFDHPVPVDFLSPEEYSERTRTDEGLLSEEEKAEMEQFEGAMRALGLLAGETDLLEATNDLTDAGTLAYYDSFEERVVVRGTEVTPGLAVTLVHELTHVIQDQVFSLDRYNEEEDEVTTGQTFAFQSLVEGDANRIEARYVESLDEATRGAIDAENEAGLTEFEEAGIPDALASLFGAPYGLGDAFVALLEGVKGQSVDAAFDQPPITEEEVFDPFEFLENGAVTPVKEPATDGEDAFDGGDFGAVSLMIVLAERIDPLQALAAATGWGGDAYVLFPRDGRTCFRLNVTGDTPDDTSELEAAAAEWVAASPGDDQSTSRGGEIVHLESCDPGEGAAEGTGGSMDAIELAVARTYVAVGALEEGADQEQARCFSSALVGGLTLDELASDELSPALERKVAALAADCR